MIFSKIQFSLIVILFISTSFQTLEKEPLFIKPQSGIGEIIIEKSTINDVTKKIGNCIVERKWRKAIETEVFGHFEYEAYSPEYDVLFETSYPKLSTKTIERIIIGPRSQIKTENGFGIGSTYFDISKKFPGKKEMVFERVGNGFETWVWFGNMNIYLNSEDTLNCVVSRIEIF